MRSYRAGYAASLRFAVTHAGYCIGCWCAARDLPRGTTITPEQAWRLADGWYRNKVKPDWRPIIALVVSGKCQTTNARVSAGPADLAGRGSTPKLRTMPTPSAARLPRRAP